MKPFTVRQAWGTDDLLVIAIVGTGADALAVFVQPDGLMGTAAVDTLVVEFKSVDWPIGDQFVRPRETVPA